MEGLRPPQPAERGRVEAFRFRSSALLDNPLGDPAERDVLVYLPPGYDAGEGRRYPVLWSLAAYTSSGQAQVAWRNHGENLPRRLDRLISERRMPPVLVAMPDTYTSLGGNQFVDSPAIGNYATYVADELVREIDQRYRTVAKPEARGLFGKSSGGFGAFHLATRFPDRFGGVVSHAGDCGFDRVYQRDFVSACDELARWDLELEAFVRGFWRARRPSGRAFHTMMTLCLSASYSPRPGQSLNLALPFDLRTARRDESIWREWLAFDPARYGEQEFSALAKLRGLWLDAGSRDQYFIHFGTRELADRLAAAGIDHHHAEFDGTHSGLDWRLDESLPWLVERLETDG